MSNGARILQNQENFHLEIRVKYCFDLIHSSRFPPLISYICFKPQGICAGLQRVRPCNETEKWELTLKTYWLSPKQ